MSPGRERVDKDWVLCDTPAVPTSLSPQASKSPKTQKPAHSWVSQVLATCPFSWTQGTPCPPTPANSQVGAQKNTTMSSDHKLVVFSTHSFRAHPLSVCYQGEKGESNSAACTGSRLHHLATVSMNHHFT